MTPLACRLLALHFYLPEAQRPRYVGHCGDSRARGCASGEILEEVEWLMVALAEMTMPSAARESIRHELPSTYRDRFLDPTGISAGLLASLTRKTRNFAGAVALALRPTVWISVGFS